LKGGVELWDGIYRMQDGVLRIWVDFEPEEIFERGLYYRAKGWQGGKGL